MSKPTVPTWKLERRTLASLRPFEHNPRRIMAKPLADLTKSIGKFGLAEPLVIQPDGLLIGGHARYQVLLAQGVKEADCYVPDRALSQKDMIELNVRLNKNVAGEFDFDALANLPEIDVADLVEFGFDEAELVGAQPPPAFQEVDENIETTHECPKCGYKWSGGDA
jgi:ParB-like chromosome segregation protein Spo0J